jgi:hypothetical protein
MGKAKQVLPPSQGARVLESCGVQAALARRAVPLPPGGQQDLREEDGWPLLAGPPATGKTTLAPGMLGEGVRHRVMAHFLPRFGPLSLELSVCSIPKIPI